MNAVERHRRVGIFAAVLATCCWSFSQANDQADSLAAIQALLPGDYLGEGSRGPVYHRIVPLRVPTLGGQIFYHHISTESFGGPAAQRKFYAFEGTDLIMRSTVLLESGVTLDSNWDMALQLTQVTEEKLLRFPDGCRFQWHDDDGDFVARVDRSVCSYDSPAFGGRVSPEMTYRLTPCDLAIAEGIYREDGRPVFPPSDITNRRMATADDTNKDAMTGCNASR
ncbi:MAG: hypothetical protein AAGI67_01525 [Pseudomonadota bacterium]